MRAAIEKICARFGDDYWLERDRDGEFPHEFHRALAADGWLGVCIPEAYGGSGLGIGEAAVMMHSIAASGAGFSGASAVHMNIFGLNPVVVYGSDEQKRRMLPPIVAGKEKACFAVTEPNAGLETAKLQTRAERRGDRYVITGAKIWITTAQVAHGVATAPGIPGTSTFAVLGTTQLGTVAVGNGGATSFPVIVPTTMGTTTDVSFAVGPNSGATATAQNTLDASALMLPGSTSQPNAGNNFTLPSGSYAGASIYAIDCGTGTLPAGSHCVTGVALIGVFDSH